MPSTFSLLTLTLSSLLISSTQAARCGSMTVTQCTDSQCSVGCQIVEQTPTTCGSDYLLQSVASGAVAASCNDARLQFVFYSSDTCIGDKNADNMDIPFGFCTINDLGSVKVEPLGEQPQFFELTPAEYEERFNQRWNINPRMNVNGYGNNNRYIPPLKNPTWLLSEMDRFDLVEFTSPFSPVMTEGFISAIGELGTFDGFWYNNKGAAGQQLYPDGLSKYFDMYSFAGITEYFIYWVWYRICDISRVFTLLPLNFWLGILSGDDMTDIWKILIPSPFLWFFHIRGERGWILG